MENLSYPARKFYAGDMVVPTHGDMDIIGVVEPDSQFVRKDPSQPVQVDPENPYVGYHMHYVVKFPVGRHAFVKREYFNDAFKDHENLRGPTWMEFVYHRNPETSEWQIGNNPAWAFWYGLAVALSVAIGGVVGGASSWLWQAACFLPLTGLITFYTIGTRRNFKGKPS